MKTARASMAALAWLGTLAVACGQDEPIGVRARFGVLPQSLDACPVSPMPMPNYVSEVDQFRIKLTGDKMGQPLLKDFTADDARRSALQLDGVPAGNARNLLVSGLAGQGQNAVTLWRGAHLGFSVSAGKTAQVPVLMTKVSTMTCRPMSRYCGAVMSTMPARMPTLRPNSRRVQS